MPCSPDEFIRGAAIAGHPLAMTGHVSDDVKMVAKLNFASEPYVLAKKRVDAVAHWTARAKALQPKEDELHKRSPEHLKSILSGKRLLLLRELMDAAGRDDPELVPEICRGFDLSGWQNVSGHFPPRVRRPEMSVETLRTLSAGLNQAVQDKMQRQQESELEAQTWAETEKELSAGWVWRDASDSWTDKVVGYRFGITQGAKVRVIDDVSICKLNSTVGLKEKYILRTVDELAAMISHVFSTHGPQADLVGRTRDLTSAYKQFGVNAAVREFVRLAVHQPNVETPVLLGLNSLPFGSVASVSSFLKHSIVLWKIGRKQLAASTEWVIDSLFTLLGIHYARDGHKALPYGDQFKMLGLNVDLSEGA